MHVEHRVVVAAPPAALFSLYQDVERWPTWDPDTRRASLDGPFQAGSRGRLVPTQGREVPMVITRVEHDRCFTVQSDLPLFRMVFEHVLTPVAGGTEVLHRATFGGPLRWLIGPLLVRRLRAGLPVTLGRLGALAESQARRGAASPSAAVRSPP